MDHSRSGGILGSNSGGGILGTAGGLLGSGGLLGGGSSLLSGVTGGISNTINNATHSNQQQQQQQQQQQHHNNSNMQQQHHHQQQQQLHQQNHPGGLQQGTAGVTNSTNSVAQAATSGVKGFTARLFGRPTPGPNTTPGQQQQQQLNNPNMRTDNLGQTILEPDENLSDKEIYPRHGGPHNIGGPHHGGLHGNNPQGVNQQNIPSIGKLIFNLVYSLSL